MLWHTKIIWVLAAAAAACGPATNPVSPGYPCGTRMHQCGNGSCCWNGQDCGGDVPSCPEGSCCFSGYGSPDPARDGGSPDAPSAP